MTALLFTVISMVIVIWFIVELFIGNPKNSLLTLMGWLVLNYVALLIKGAL